MASDRFDVREVFSYRSRDPFKVSDARFIDAYARFFILLDVLTLNNIDCFRAFCFVLLWHERDVTKKSNVTTINE